MFELQKINLKKEHLILIILIIFTLFFSSGLYHKILNFMNKHQIQILAKIFRSLPLVKYLLAKHEYNSLKLLLNFYISSFFTFLTLIPLAFIIDLKNLTRVRDYSEENKEVNLFLTQIQKLQKLKADKNKINFGYIIQNTSKKYKWGINLKELKAPHCLIFGASGTGKTSTTLNHFVDKYCTDNSTALFALDSKDGLIKRTAEHTNNFFFASKFSSNLEKYNEKKVSIELFNLVKSFPTITDGIKKIFVEYLDLQQESKTWELYGKRAFSGLIAYFFLHNVITKQQSFLYNKEIFEYLRNFDVLNLPDIMTWLDKLNKELTKTIKFAETEQQKNNLKSLIEITKYAINNLLAVSKNDEHAESIRTNLNTVIEVFTHQNFFEFSQGKNINILKALKEKQNIFLSTMSDNQCLPKIYNVIVNFVLEQFFEDSNTLRLVVLMDEASSYKIAKIRDILDKGRSWGISLTQVYQDLSQIERVYSKSDVQTFLSNASLIFTFEVAAKTLKEILTYKAGDRLTTITKKINKKDTEHYSEVSIKPNYIIERLNDINEKYYKIGRACLVLASTHTNFYKFISLNLFE